MVAKTVELPNIRKLFEPDLGYVICDCDLAQADAQIVACEADDDELKAIFKDPTADLHDENAKTIFGTVNKRNRQLAKAGVHATNYYCKPPTLARTLGITIKEADYFQKRWFSAHPGILDWHNRVEAAISTTRTVYNCFGNRRFFFERVQSILPEALAWIPQSTVAQIINHGIVNLDEQLSDQVELLLQVHDSCVMQFKKEYLLDLLPKIKKCLEIPLELYDNWIVPTGADISEVSWGDVKPINWDGTWKEAA